MNRCIGTRGTNGCGFTGDHAPGGVCPLCGGMILSDEGIKQAEVTKAIWEKQDSVHHLKWSGRLMVTIGDPRQ